MAATATAIERLSCVLAALVFLRDSEQVDTALVVRKLRSMAAITGTPGAAAVADDLERMQREWAPPAVDVRAAA